MLYVVMVPHLTFKYIVYLFPTKVASRLFCLVCAHCCVGHLLLYVLKITTLLYHSANFF